MPAHWPQSRANCQLKYCQKLASWAKKGACRPRLGWPSSRMGGLPYCTRLSTSFSAWLKNPIGSPSLIAGNWAARSGR